MNQSIITHMESHLGPMARGWSPADGQTSVHVCLFEDSPAPGVVTHATLGLSRHVLGMPHGREVRQELLLPVVAPFAGEDLPKLLAHVADEILRQHLALLRGQVVPLGCPVVRGSPRTHLYVALPVVFPEGLATCLATQPPTVFAWLLPIDAAEAAFVKRVGWSDFEDRLEMADLDLFDPQRHSVVEQNG